MPNTDLTKSPARRLIPLSIIMLAVAVSLFPLSSYLMNPKALAKAGGEVVYAAAPVTSLDPRPAPAPAYKLHGLNFGPYVDGQDPNIGSPQVSEQQLRERMQIIAPYTQWVRTFSCLNGLEKAGGIAHEFGLKAAVGAWLSDNLSANELEIAEVISVAKAGHADMVIVGSEALRRGDVSAEQLKDYIERVKQEIPAGIPVTTGEIYPKWLEHAQTLVPVVDVLFVNYYPYWEGVRIEDAMRSLDHAHRQMIDIAGGKSVIVSETGWPSGGNQVGCAVPSPENAAFFFLNFVSWARANNVQYFYFEALDESWKANYEGPQGAHWGVWDKDGNLKPGMDAVFDGSTIADNWSSIPGGPGDPAVEFTYVPPYNSFEDLTGRVLHVSPSDYKVALYIKVGSGWWTKPFFGAGLTDIRADGGWRNDITTGGNDHLATKIAAFLVPNGYDPPEMSGGATLPAELSDNAVAQTEITRSPDLLHIGGQVVATDACLPTSDILITLGGSQSATTKTGFDGRFSFINLPPGDYTVTPSKNGYTFDPAARQFNGLSANQTANFQAQAIPQPPPVISVNDKSAAEGNAGSVNVVFNVKLSRASSSIVSLKFATANGTAHAGSDYAPATGTLTFIPGQITKTVSVQVNGDLLDEPNETFFLNLSAATGAVFGDAQGLCTIADDDALPNLKINNVTMTEGNASVNASLTVSLSAPSGKTITVKYATANSSAVAPGDFTATSGTLSFAPGQTVKTINIAVKGDLLDEVTEAFKVLLSNPVNATIADGEGACTIVDNDPLPSITISNASVTEPDGGTINALFTVKLSAASGKTVTVKFVTANGTAAAGTDYTGQPLTTLTFSPGQTTKTVTVQVNGDTLKEQNETFFVNLSGAANATIADAQGLGTILNDD